VDILEGAKALAVDYSGNVYVTGNVWHHERTDHDYITVKYDSTGDEQWRKFYNYAYVKNDNAYAIAVDGWGNVYVTGFSQGWDENYDYATLKYAPDGTRLWEQRYNGPGNGNDVAVSLTLDDNGNVFITGYSMGSYTGMDFATIKYWSNSGNLSWVTRSNGLVNGDDFARKIEIDAYGNAYVIGVSDGEDKTDFLTVKYSTAGTPLWAARYDRPGMSWESGYDIKIDASANVYVTGESNFGYNLKTCSQ
jgi:hypothetical protein